MVLLWPLWEINMQQDIMTGELSVLVHRVTLDSLSNIRCSAISYNIKNRYTDQKHNTQISVGLKTRPQLLRFVGLQICQPGLFRFPK